MGNLQPHPNHPSPAVASRRAVPDHYQLRQLLPNRLHVHQVQAILQPGQRWPVLHGARCRQHSWGVLGTLDCASSHADVYMSYFFPFHDMFTLSTVQSNVGLWRCCQMLAKDTTVCSTRQQAAPPPITPLLPPPCMRMQCSLGQTVTAASCAQKNADQCSCKTCKAGFVSNGSGGCRQVSRH